MRKRKVDIILLVSVILLISFSLVMIYSSSSVWALYKFNDSFKYVKQQLLFIIVGIILMFLISKVDYKWYLKKTNIILGVCLFLLVCVLIPGIGSIRNGSRSWFGIGSFGIQPSEFMKLALIIFVSKYLTNNSKDLNNIIKGVLPILLILFLIFFLIMLQPDFGTGMIIVISVLAMMFIAGVSIKFFIGLGLIGIVGIVGLIAVAPYRMDRITSFINPWSDPLGTGFQIIQSLYAIGPGDVFDWR